MISDFYDAHYRHWEDAETLYHEGRLPNADHLYGMSAECGLKQLMMKFGMPVDPITGIPLRQDRVHANCIWIRYETYRSGKSAGVNYALQSSDPFFDWDVNQRYANRSHFDNSRIQPHRAGALEVQKLIKKAEIEGLIS